MNKKIASALLGVLLIGIVTAGLVPYLSNIVSGSVEVKGPVFYAASGNNLLINEFDDSTSEYEIDDGNLEIFLTQNLDEPLDFYRPSLNLQVKAKLVDGIIPKDLILEFGYFDSNNNLEEICRDTISVSSNDFQLYPKSCNGNSELSNVNGFYYRIIGMGGEGVKYRISVTDGTTKVEMSKAT